MALNVFVFLSFAGSCWALQTSNGACLQIFSVPKQNVVCDPSQDVLDQITSVQKTLDTQAESMHSLESKLISLDPDAYKTILLEVQDKLNTIEELKDNQTSQESILDGFGARMVVILAKIASLESSNKGEIAQLIQMQTELIGVMWQQTNLTLHERYLEQLNKTVGYFLRKLNETEVNIKDAFATKEVDILQQLEQQSVKYNDMIGSLETKVKAMDNVIKKWQHLTPRAIKVFDCQDALKFYNPVSGVYSINPGPTLQPYDVYCDMRDVGDDGQGWTVIQRRLDGSVDFFRGWSDFRDGFGDAEGEYWLGLEKLHTLTSTKQYSLQINLQDWKDKWWLAEYEKFSVGNEKTNYTLHVSGFHGDAGDSLSYHDGMPFSTLDRNNDRKEGLCATWCHGAWWYRDCFLSNLNGRYYGHGPYIPETNWGNGVNWKTTFNTYYYSFKTVAMKIRATA